MEAGKAPRSNLRQPSKINLPLMTARTALLKPMALRRRSKSVTDLRSMADRPLRDFKTSGRVPAKISEKPAVTRPAAGVKRGALTKKEDAPKPKVAKVKIPDWDYKSRFNDLLGRHTTLQETLKKANSRLEALSSTESELTDLRAEVTQLKTANANLQTQNETLTSCKCNLVKEISELQSGAAKLTTELSIIKTQHGDLRSRFKELQSEHLTYKESCRNLSDELATLQGSYDELKSSNELLKDDLDAHEVLRRSMHNTIQDLKGNIRVFCRVRPQVGNESDKLLCALQFPDEASLSIKKSRESVSVINGKPMDLKQEFSFDKVFPPQSSQAEVFEELSLLVQSALDGYNVCVFAYGQTGSGKTHTMTGTDNDHGMIPRTINLIFEKIDKLEKADWKYTVTASFLEIYNEKIKDLLQPTSYQNFELRNNEGTGITVTHLKIVQINSANELVRLMEQALRKRSVAATDFNENSSRSHAVTKIHLEGHNKTSNIVYRGSIHLVDLAGSENAKSANNAHNDERLTETKNINRSLSNLGNVMLALKNRDPHIPYRNSKLTYLLQSCLGGNSKTLMFVNISPMEECYAESINSLRFASKVREVKTNSKKTKTHNGPAILIN